MPEKTDNMRNRGVRFLGCLATVATAFITIAIGTARADQVEVGNPMPKAPVVLEMRRGHDKVSFEIVNTGVPDVAEVTLGSITETLVGVSGDVFDPTKLDVIAMGIDIGCDHKMLGVGLSCTQTANYFILDGDPFDKKESDPGLPPAVWRFGISVPWTDTSGGHGTATDSVLITVKDEPVPEPGTLLTLASGILGLAGMARKRLFS